MSHSGSGRARERVPTGRRGRPSKWMIAAALERPFCAYLHKICLNNRLEGHKYCIDHIMNDKTAPFRQCTFVHTITGRRCTRAAHKVDRRASPLCHYHKALQTAHILPQTDILDDESSNDPEALLEELAHYKERANARQHEHISSNSPDLKPSAPKEVPPSPKQSIQLEDIKIEPETLDGVDPISIPTIQEDVPMIEVKVEDIKTELQDTSDPDINNKDDLLHLVDPEPSQDLLEPPLLTPEPIRHDPPKSQRQQISTNKFWITRSDGRAEPSEKLRKTIARYNLQRMREEARPAESTMEEIAACHKTADSDTESVDNMDVFKHASVFSEEELTRILRDKMVKLRRLYIEQFGHTQYVLKEKRLKFIQAQRIEDEQFGDAYSFRNNKESPDYERLRAMLRYHKTFGPNYLLSEQAKKRRLSRPPPVGPHPDPNKQAVVEPPSTDSKHICIFPQGCDRTALPLSPYCRNHILYDTKQVLYRPCAGGTPPCLTPIVSFVRKNKCWLHMAINN